MNYENLFRPGYIGGLRIKNRVVMTAMGNGLAAENGEASDEIIACYKARAAARSSPRAGSSTRPRAACRTK